MVEREKVDRLTHKNQHAQGVPPPSYRYEGGRTSSTPKNYFFDVLDDGDLSKSTGNVGQQAKDNRRGFRCQCDIG
ncbi:TPA: hypothetical protein JI109_03925 [Acinetobacter baumannii]|nr:hypothetical protein [Acinetobacter baumannii]